MTQQSDLFASESQLATESLRHKAISAKTRINLLLWDLQSVAKSHNKWLAVRFDTGTSSSCNLILVSVFLEPGELPPLGFAWTIYSDSDKEPYNVQA